jgi:hypothetical protein
MVDGHLEKDLPLGTEKPSNLRPSLELGRRKKGQLRQEAFQRQKNTDIHLSFKIPLYLRYRP